MQAHWTLAVRSRLLRVGRFSCQCYVGVPAPATAAPSLGRRGSTGGVASRRREASAAERRHCKPIAIQATREIIGFFPPPVAEMRHPRRRSPRDLSVEGSTIVTPSRRSTQKCDSAQKALWSARDPPAQPRGDPPEPMAQCVSRRRRAPRACHWGVLPHWHDSCKRCFLQHWHRTCTTSRNRARARGPTLSDGNPRFPAR